MSNSAVVFDIIKTCKSITQNSTVLENVKDPWVVINEVFPQTLGQDPLGLVAIGCKPISGGLHST